MTRSVGFFLLACSGLCALIAYECYQTKLRTAQEVARLLNLQFVSIPLPIETQVASFLGVMIGVAGIVCLLDFWKQSRRGKVPELGQ